MIRRFEATDRPAVLGMLRDLHREGVYSRVELCWDKVERQVDSHCAGLWNLTGFVGEVGGEVAGVLLVACAENWFSRELFGFDVVFYVKPDRRGMLLGRGLLRAYEAWGKEMGCCQVSVGVSSGIMVERTGRMLRRLGFAHDGGIYRRNV